VVVYLSAKVYEQEDTVFHKKLKVKMKNKGDEGRIGFLEDYIDYLLRGKKLVPPDFPTFAREIMGLDERKGWIHIVIWHKDSELVEFAMARGYEYKIDHYD
jgi:hypothetical protein